MSFQIKSVVLYKEGHKPRVVNFKEGINIVSGDPNTGKSTLIHIIDYCLGRSVFGVYAGVTRQTVDWYAVLLQIDDTQVFLAKPSPPAGSSQYTLVHFEADAKVDIPQDSRNLEATYNSREVALQMFKLMHSAPVEDIEGSTALHDLEIGVDKTLFYLFQEKSVIANNQVLFHRQGGNSDAIRQTLPYFLGIREQEDLEAQRLLKQARERVNSLNTKLNWEEKRFSVVSEMRQSLVAEAQEAGLLESGFSSEDPGAIKDAFQEIVAEWKPANLEKPEGGSLPGLPPVEDRRIPRLQDEINELNQAFEHKKWEIQTVKSYARSTEGYSEAIGEQYMRLESVDLISLQDGLLDTICPLCNCTLDTSPPGVLEMRSSLRALRAKLDEEVAVVPRMDATISKLEEEVAEIKSEIRSKQLKVREILEKQEATKRDVIQNIFLSSARVERIVGRIQLYLDLVGGVDSIRSLSEQLMDAKEQVETLKERYDPDRIKKRQDRIMGSISDQMSEWARKLHIEHRGDYRLDLESLTVVVETSRQSISMEQMGGRSNWLGCHLISLLALHKRFTKYALPVPNFLVLDQPAQGYFPSDDYEITSYPYQMRLEGSDYPSSYVEAVQEMFDFLFDVSEDLPGFQLIILERAYIDSPRFQDKLVDGRRWDSDYALIPKSWLEG